MEIFLAATSHSALSNNPVLKNEAEEKPFRAALAGLAEKVRDFDPDLILQFGNDHNSGMSLRLMPPFMVGMRAKALGDFDTSTGPLLVDEDASRTIASGLHDKGIDIATTYDWTVDHGFVWALDQLLGGIDKVPVVPVFTNCGGDLRPPFHRSYELGKTIGEILKRDFTHRRVLILASGGLSHDPPLPSFKDSPPEVQEAMIRGTTWDKDSLELRKERVAQAGIEHAAGEGDLKPLNPEWDAWIMSRLEQGDLGELASMEDSVVIETGGRGGSEVRNWLSAFAAMRAAAGEYSATRHYYRPLPHWIVGWGMMYAEAA
jgi:2,3-dihydroxyphenylpropionate 1,2-dioxygenase